jgi:hypothetical protein
MAQARAAQQPTTALVTSQLLQQELDANAKELIDLLAKSSLIPRDLLMRVADEYKTASAKSGTVSMPFSTAASKGSEIAPALREKSNEVFTKNQPTLVNRFRNFFGFGAKLPEETQYQPVKQESPLAPNLYQHLLTTFYTPIHEQLMANTKEAYSKTSSKTVNDVYLVSYSSLPIQADALQKYAKHLCEIDTKAAGEVLGKYATGYIVYTRQQPKCNATMRALIENGADLNIACKEYALDRMVQYNELSMLEAFVQAKQAKEIDIKHFEHALAEAVCHGKHTHGDVLFKNRSDLKINAAVLMYQRYDDEKNVVDTAKVKYLFAHGAELLDMATSYHFHELVRRVNNEPEGTYAKTIERLKNFAKNEERKTFPQDIMEALFKDVVPGLWDMDIEAPHAWMVAQLISLAGNESLRSSAGKQEVDERVKVGRAILALNKVREELLLENNRAACASVAPAPTAATASLRV